jgi:four helix bundle protein
MTFAVKAAEAARPLFANEFSHHAADQLTRASSAVASNYRAAGRARSRAEFLAKLGIVVEEADESQYWLEYMKRTHMPIDGLDDLLQEAGELTAIFSASRRTGVRNAESLARHPPRRRPRNR